MYLSDLKVLSNSQSSSLSWFSLKSKFRNEKLLFGSQKVPEQAGAELGQAQPLLDIV